ncbi:MAG: hypothetical protein HQL58_03045 [Magnetococcales bacterium]|nr:hypothetical protein [Magnetococcales bacterium]
MIDIHQLQRQLDQNGIIFCYRGAVTQDITETIGVALRTQMDMHINQPITNSRVFAAFVELVQNISRYSRESLSSESSPLKSGMIVIGELNHHYYIQCGNLIWRQESGSLQDYLTKIKAMSKSELTVFYREQRRSGTTTDKGAGLGFIDLARHATSFDFTVTPVDQQYVFFSICITL